MDSKLNLILQILLKMRTLHRNLLKICKTTMLKTPIINNSSSNSSNNKMLPLFTINKNKINLWVLYLMATTNSWT